MSTVFSGTRLYMFITISRLKPAKLMFTVLAWLVSIFLATPPEDGRHHGGFSRDSIILPRKIAVKLNFCYIFRILSSLF